MYFYFSCFIGYQTDRWSEIDRETLHLIVRHCPLSVIVSLKHTVYSGYHQWTAARQDLMGHVQTTTNRDLVTKRQKSHRQSYI